MSNNKIIKPKEVEFKPSVDLRYLKHSNHCLKNAANYYRKNRKELNDFFDDFQMFIHNFSQKKEISESIKQFSSKNGAGRCEIIKKDFVANLINRLPVEVREFAKDELVHLHLKPNGKGKAVIFAFVQNNSLNVFGIDLEHEFNK